MIRKHKTTAEMVKQFLNVIEERVERTNKNPQTKSSRFEEALKRTAI